jgi:glycosyltransferase involved in cell wall biosynthesis
MTIVWDQNWPLYALFNQNVVDNIAKRIQPKDFICLITSHPNEPVVRAFPHPQYQTVEFGIGYESTIAEYRVFESECWRNFVYGMNNEKIGKAFDTVIPNYYHVEEYPIGTGKRDYFLFAGRLIDTKGHHLASDVCERLGYPFKLIGLGEPPRYGEYLGFAGPDMRSELMGNAIALFVPTQYVGPFEGVHAEAQLCGTPVITTNFGIFTETVINGFNGVRCNNFNDYAQAAQSLWNGDWKPNHEAIRANAINKWSVDVVAKQYEEYFERLLSLWNDGFYAGWGLPST